MVPSMGSDRFHQSATASKQRQRFNRTSVGAGPSKIIKFPRNSRTLEGVRNYALSSSRSLALSSCPMMICQRCLNRLRGSRTTRQRFFSTSRSSFRLDTLSSPRGPASGSHEGPPAATSTSAAQPFSTPLTASSAPAQISQTPAAPTISSSVPAGTPLKGLGYFKGKDPPIAKEDHEYPLWLWSLLDKRKEGVSVETEEMGDFYCRFTEPRFFTPAGWSFLPITEGEAVSYQRTCANICHDTAKSKAKRRIAAKAAARAAKTNSVVSARKVPLEHQSIDLPGGDGSLEGAMAAARAREEVREAMRKGRRKGIKEGNFLKTMG